MGIGTPNYLFLAIIFSISAFIHVKIILFFVFSRFTAEEYRRRLSRLKGLNPIPTAVVLSEYLQRYSDFFPLVPIQE